MAKNTHSPSLANKISFSALELELIELLPENKSEKLSTIDLVKRYYGDDPPMNARIIIIGRLRCIEEKALRASLPWRLRRTKRSGPIPQSFWLEKL